jgi:hypothetical protein
MIGEPYLEAQGVTIFSTGVDFEREILTVEVAAADEDKASALVRERYGDRVEVEVVAPAAWVVEDVAWECWTPVGLGDRGRSRRHPARTALAGRQRGHGTRG